MSDTERSLVGHDRLEGPPPRIGRVAPWLSDHIPVPITTLTAVTGTVSWGLGLYSPEALPPLTDHLAVELFHVVPPVIEGAPATYTYTASAHLGPVSVVGGSAEDPDDATVSVQYAVDLRPGVRYVGGDIFWVRVTPIDFAVPDADLEFIEPTSLTTLVALDSEPWPIVRDVTIGVKP